MEKTFSIKNSYIRNFNWIFKNCLELENVLWQEKILFS
jgi:hypothetical protein